MTATMYDSGPTWLFGPRAYNGKFGGAGGGGSKLLVVDRALAVQAVFQRLREEGVIGDKWYTSYHTGHELVPEHPDLQCIRNPHAIDWAQLVALSQEGKIPLTNALTHGLAHDTRTHEVRDDPLHEIVRHARQSGHFTDLKQAALQKVLQGVTTFEEAAATVVM